MLTEQAKKLGEKLVEAKLITAEQLSNAMVATSKENSPSLIVWLIQSDLLTYQVYEKFLTKALKIKSTIIATRSIDQDLVKRVGEDLIKDRHIFPITMVDIPGGKALALGMVDPLDTEVLGLVEKRIGARAVPVLISLPDYKQTTQTFFGGPAVE